MPETKLTTQADAFASAAEGSMRYQLIVIEGPDMGRAVSFDGQRPLSVGTGREAQLQLRDERVSARHLELARTSQQSARFRVVDLGSTNGTLYEGSRITEAEVAAGATLKVGHTFLRILPAPRTVEVSPSRSRRFGELVAESLAMREVFGVLELAAASDVTLLVEGESGTGKELVARGVHEASARRKAPFVAIDCGAIPESLLESELFGHVKGAFTGAASARAGAFARAHGGTLFLDELATVSLSAQARLLRVIEERRVRPVGSDEEREVDVRIIGATMSGLSQRVAEGKFRPDLYYRLSVLALSLPPLRSRREDIPAIVRELLRLRGFDAGELRGTNLELLMGHAWPGNVRELRNVVDRALALSPGARTFEELRMSLPRAGGAREGDTDTLAVRSDLPFKDAKERVVEAFERQYLREVLSREGSISGAARVADVDRKHLRGLLRRYGLVPGGEGDEE